MFASCIAILPYRSGSFLGFDLGRDGQWTMVVGGTALKLRKAAKLDVAFQVDAGTLYPAKTEPARFRKGVSQLGESVHLLGFPLAGQLDNGLNFTSGVISSLAGPGNDRSVVQITAPAQPGNSGGPVVDASGLVTGVMQSKLNDRAALRATGSVPQNVNFGIKSPRATEFLRANGVEPQEVDAGRTLTGVAIARDAAAYTVQVKCTVK